MRKKFLSNLAFLFFLNFLVKPFWIFGIDRTVQNTVGAENYGTYFSLLNFSILFQMLLDAGINNYNNRYIAQNPSQLKKYFSNIFILKVCLSIAYFLFCSLLALALGFSSYQIQLLFILLINQVLLSFILYFRSNISALQNFRLDSLLSVTDKLFMIFIAGFLLLEYSGSFRIEWFIYAQTVSYGITALVSFIPVYLKAGNIQLQWNRNEIFSLLKKTYPYGLLVLLMTIYYRIDGVMIERLLPEQGAREAGFYAAGYRILDAFNIIGFLFASLLLPMFSRMLIAEKGKVADLVRFSFKLIFVIALIASTTCYFYKFRIMKWLYTAYIPYFGEIFGYLILTFIPVAIVYIFGTLLTANGKLRMLNQIAVGGMVLNISLNYFLIEQHGAIGAAFATLISQLIIAFAHLYCARQDFGWKIPWKIIMQVVIFTVCILVIQWLMGKADFTWQWNFLLTAALCLIPAILTGMLPVEKVRRFWKEMNE